MPYRFAFDRSASLALVTLEGQATGEELFYAAVELPRQDEWAAGMDVIWDGRTLSELVVLPGEIQRHARYKTEHRALFGDGRDLLVLDRTFHQVAAELYAVLARMRGREAHVVSSVREALEALGLADFPPGLLPHPEAASAA